MGKVNMKHPRTAWHDIFMHFLANNLLKNKNVTMLGKENKKRRKSWNCFKTPSTAGFTTWQIHTLCFAIFLLAIVKNLQCLIIPSLVLWMIFTLNISLLILVRKESRELWGGSWKGRQLHLSHLNKWNVTDLTENPWKFKPGSFGPSP